MTINDVPMGFGRGMTVEYWFQASIEDAKWFATINLSNGLLLAGADSDSNYTMELHG